MIYLLIDHSDLGHISLGVGLAEVGSERFEYQSLVVADHSPEIYQKLSPKGDIPCFSGGEEFSLRGYDFKKVGGYAVRIDVGFHNYSHSFRSGLRPEKLDFRRPPVV